MDSLIKIIGLLEEARTKHNINKIDLERNGDVFYNNANDGTEFDWKCNNRLCEFGYGVKDGSAWAFKLLLNSYGEATVYCYPNGEMLPVDKVSRQLMSAEEAEELKDYMYDISDAKMKWNCTLNELGVR